MKNKLVVISLVLAIFTGLLSGCVFGREEESSFLDAPVVQVKDQLFPQVYFKKYNEVKYLAVYRNEYSGKKKVNTVNVGIIYPSNHAGDECRFQDRFFVEDVDYTYYGRYILQNGEEYITAESEKSKLTNRANGGSYVAHDTDSVMFSSAGNAGKLLYDPAQNTVTVGGADIVQPAVSSEASKIYNKIILANGNKTLVYDIGEGDLTMAGTAIYVASLVMSDFPRGGQFKYEGLLGEYREVDSKGNVLFVSWTERNVYPIELTTSGSFAGFSIDPLNVQNGLDYSPAP